MRPLTGATAVFQPSDLPNERIYPEDWLEVSEITAPGDRPHPAISFPRCTKRIVGAAPSARVLRSN
jgi:hypothetical protein